MDLLQTILTALIASGGAVSFTQFLISRHDKKCEDKDGLSKKLDSIERGLGEKIDGIEARLQKNELADAQTHLLLLIRFYPKDRRTILAEAEYYLCELHGDSWVWQALAEWAEKEGVNIDWLEKAHLANIKKENEKE